MNLDAVFNTFINSQTLLMCLGTWVMTYVIRTVVESLWKGAKTNIYWRELFVPLGAIVNGALLALVMKSFIWPDFVGDSRVAKMLYGAICGVFSGFVYGRIRSWIWAKAEQKEAVGGGEPVNPNPYVPPAPSTPEPAIEAPLGGHDETPPSP